MSALDALRDDGPLASRAFGPLDRSRYAWLGPPLVRALEYGGLIALTASVDQGALPACFGFLAAIAFHHYDTIYRPESSRGTPARLVWALGGGWELRLAAAGILAVAGVLETGLIVGAIVLGALYAGEAAWSCLRSRGTELSPGELTADAEALE